MNKSINLYCNSEISTEEKIKAFKAVGYDDFYTGMYDRKETMAVKEQLEFAKRLGMLGNMMHCSYYEPDLNYFWEDCEIGEKVCDSYIQQIESCEGICKNFVVHLNGAKGSKQTVIGLNRILRILKACEKFDTNLCIENLYSEYEIPYIFKNISHKNLKICYDIGHVNFLTPDFKICEQFGQYITVLHIHENNGIKDEHKPLTVGGKIFKKLANELAYLDKNVTLAAEIKVTKEEFYSAIKQSLDSFNCLERVVNGVEK